MRQGDDCELNEFETLGQSHLVFHPSGTSLMTEEMKSGRSHEIRLQKCHPRDLRLRSPHQREKSEDGCEGGLNETSR